jgi:DNA replication protein DnaC
MTRSRALSSVPERKINNALERTVESCDEDRGKPINAGLCKSCRAQNAAIMRYAESNIPVEYWSLTMEEHFQGFKGLMDKYSEIVGNLTESYEKGRSIIFSGKNGTGKTMTCCCILRCAAQAAYTCQYTTLGDIVNLVSTAPVDEKYNGRRELMGIDFLVIDEFDPRWMATDKAADLYGRTLEDIFRARLQNKLPTLMCTNSSKVTDSFSGPLKLSIESLMHKMELVSVSGAPDFRGKGKATK